MIAGVDVEEVVFTWFVVPLAALWFMVWGVRRAIENWRDDEQAALVGCVAAFFAFLVSLPFWTGDVWNWFFLSNFKYSIWLVILFGLFVWYKIVRSGSDDAFRDFLGSIAARIPVRVRRRTNP